MKRIPLLIAIFLSMANTATSQKQFFTYNRSGVTTILWEGKNIVKLEKYKAIKGTRKRQVSINGEIYFMIISRPKNLLIQTFVNANGDTLGTVNFNGNNRFDIKLSDGTALDYSSTDKTSAYRKDDGIVAKIETFKEDGKKMITIETLDPIAANPVVLLSCLERGIEKYKAAATVRTVALLSSVVIGVVGAVVSSNNQPEIQ